MEDIRRDEQEVVPILMVQGGGCPVRDVLIRGAIIPKLVAALS